MQVTPHAEIAAMQAKRRALVPARSSAPKTAQELRLYVDRIICADKVDRSTSERDRMRSIPRTGAVDS
jgi:hypothetical protein